VVTVLPSLLAPIRASVVRFGHHFHHPEVERDESRCLVREALPAPKRSGRR
jgi:hypothetical protein